MEKKTVLLYEKREHCYGCGACESICPVQAIRMQFDEKGHYYPKINEETCVKCQMCIRVCPFGKEKNL